MPNDCVLDALHRFERLTRARRHEGQLSAWRLAVMALEEYRRRESRGQGQQLALPGVFLESAQGRSGRDACPSSA